MNKQKTVMIKDWITFIAFVLFLLATGAIIGFRAGMSHPAVSVKDQWLSGIREEVDKLQEFYEESEAEYQLGIKLRDSIISTMKREIVKDIDANTPIKVNINTTEDDSE